MLDSRSNGEWRYGWPMVAAGMVGMTLANLHTASLGTMMLPLSDAFGWDRSEIATGMLINSVVLMFWTPIVALIIPRYGVRKIVFGGTLLFAAGLVTLGFCTPSIWSWYFGWAVMGTALSFVCALIWTTMIMRAFVRHRGLALSVALSGSGIATLITPLITAYSLQKIGLRAPFFVLATLVGLVILPALLWLMSRRDDFGTLQVVPNAAAPTAQDNRKLREVLVQPTLWKLILISMLTALPAGMLFAHLQPMLRDAGASTTRAAVYFTIAGPALVVGRVGTGIMLDWLPTRAVAAVMFLFPAITCLLLLGYEESAASGFAICLFFGLGFGAESDLLAYLTARYFGTHHYPIVYSLVYGIFAAGTGLGGIVGGATFDFFGSYRFALFGLIGCTAAAILLLAAMGPARALSERSNTRDGAAVA